MDSDQLDRFQRLVDRRAAGEPVQHLTGTAGFRHLELAVGPGVFIPRPETELLIDWGLSALPAGRAPVVLDLCAGSGALGLAMAQERPDARVYLVERSAAALRYLTRNAAARAAAGDRPVRVIAADATDPGRPAELAGLAGTVDLVLTNPPYIPDGTELPPEVAGGDPSEALYGGPDGLAVIRPLIARAAELLRPGGGLAVEHDDRHGTAVPELLRADGRYQQVADHPDLTGRPRFASAIRTSDAFRPV